MTFVYRKHIDDILQRPHLLILDTKSAEAQYENIKEEIIDSDASTKLNEDFVRYM